MPQSIGGPRAGETGGDLSGSPRWAYTYLQEYLVQAAQATVRQGWIDAVGLGRMVLSYPELPADSLAGRVLARNAICRTFSDCTTAPRNGLRSGCYPLDAYYKALPEAAEMKAIKAHMPDTT